MFHFSLVFNAFFGHFIPDPARFSTARQSINRTALLHSITMLHLPTVHKAFPLSFLFLFTSCRSTSPTISSESSCRRETAFEQSHTAQSSSSFFHSLCETLDADSIRILFVSPQCPEHSLPANPFGSLQGQASSRSFEPDDVPATDIVDAVSAASITIYGAHFESERESSLKVEDILSDSISSLSAASAESSEHVAPQPNHVHNTSRRPRMISSYGWHFMKKYVLVPLLLLLLTALIRRAVKAVIRRFIG